MRKIIVVASAVIVCFFGSAPGKEKSKEQKLSPAMVRAGQKLFRTESISTNGKSCASCHESSGGHDLAKMASDDAAELPKSVNHCLTTRLEAKKEWSKDSRHMKAMVEYIKYLKLKAGRK